MIAVFIPTAFLEGISGQFYKQFGMTIAVATAISVFVSLTLSPAMAALLMKHEEKSAHKKTPTLLKPLAYVGNTFNGFMERLSDRYGKGVQKLVRMKKLLELTKQKRKAETLGIDADEFEESIAPTQPAPSPPPTQPAPAPSNTADDILAAWKEEGLDSEAQDVDDLARRIDELEDTL